MGEDKRFLFSSLRVCWDDEARLSHTLQPVLRLESNDAPEGCQRILRGVAAPSPGD